MREKLTAITIVVLATVVTAVLVIGWRFAIFVLPFSWTEEPVRIARLLRVGPGSVVADIGAGDGAMAVEIARLVGRQGTVYATELSPERQQDIMQRASQADTPQISVVRAAADATRLPDDCCDAVYLRTVFHHIGDRAAFAREIGKAVRPGGRVGIIDFPPGALWFHGGDHGVSPENVIQAFQAAGWRPAEQIENWGGGTYFLLFERAAQ